MSRKKNKSGNGDDTKEGDSGPTVGRSYKLQTLTSDNYDAWERRLKAIFYAMDWTSIYEAAQTISQTAQVTNAQRRQAWGLVYCSLEDEMTAKVDDVNAGDVEGLLRAVRGQFYKSTIQTKTKLKKMLEKAQLEDHPDIGTYIAYIKAIIKRLKGMGYDVPDEDAEYRLLEGLPPDYESVKRVIRMPRDDPLTWEQIVFMLEDYASDPRIPGSGHKSTSKNSSHTTHEQQRQVCYRFARTGKCRHGDKCRYRHENAPGKDAPTRPTCGYCKKRGHTKGECRKKKKDEERKHDKSHATTDATTSDKPQAPLAPAPPIPPEERSRDMSFPIQEVIDIAAATKFKRSLQGRKKTRGTTLWLLDGGSNCAVTTDPGICFDIEPADIDIKVGGGTIKCYQVGKALLNVPLPDGTTRPIIKHGLRIVPTFGVNVIPESHFLQKGCRVIKELGYADHGRGPAVLRATPRAGTGLHYFTSTQPDAQPAEHLTYGSISSTPATTHAPSGNSQRDISSAFPETRRLQSTYGTASSSNISLSETSRRTFLLSGDLQHWEPATSTGAMDTAAAVQVCAAASEFSTPSPELLLWHVRLGHRNFQDVARLIGAKLPAKPVFCSSCVQGKGTRYHLSKHRETPLHEAPRPGYMLHTDVKGPFSTNTRGGNRYLIVHVDDYSRKVFLTLERTTGIYFERFKDLVRKLEADFGRDKVVAQVLADSATYYERSQPLRDFCRQKGILQLFSPPYTQSLNGVAERTIRTLIGMARTMLIHAGAPRFLYGEALHYAAYVLNRLPWRTGETQSRIERWLNKPAGSAHKSIRTWGCAAWDHRVHPTGPAVDTLEPRAIKKILVGIDEARQCYRLLSLPHYKLSFSAHVHFDENDFPCRKLTGTSMEGSDFTRTTPRMHTPTDPLPLPQRPSRGWTPSATALENLASQVPEPPDTSTDTSCVSYIDFCSNNEALDLLDKSYALYQRAGAWRGNDANLMRAIDMAHASIAAGDPIDHYDAMRRPDASAWRQAEISEYRSHIKNGTFGPPVTLPKGFKAIPTAHVYKTKRCGRHKVRVVVRGYHMQQGRDYNETFAPVARPTTFRSLFALAAKHDWEIAQADVHTAFLASDMDSEVYVYLPAGFHDDPSTKPRPKDVPREAHRMLKGVPGIPQGSHLWHKKSSKEYFKAGMKRAPDDYSLYYIPNHHIYLVVWVDDLFLFYSKEHSPRASQLMLYLQNSLDIDEWKPIDDCLACQVRRDRPAKTITISQQKAVEALLQRSGMRDCAVADTPVASGAVFTKSDCTAANKLTNFLEETKWYRSMLASCIYIGMWTRPDIAFAISKLSKFMQNPGPKHITGLKRLLRYLQKTKHLGLVYSFDTSPNRTGVYGYYDAAHADDIDTRRSTMAYLFFFEGCAISWHSKLHSYVTTSTNHSEYCAAAKAAAEAKFLEKLFDTIGFGEAVHPIALFSDSQGAIAMTYNPVNRSASKHVDLADHYAREQVERGTITVSHVGTKQMIADALTKALPAPLFEQHRSQFLGNTAP